MTALQDLVCAADVFSLANATCVPRNCGCLAIDWCVLLKCMGAADDVVRD